MACIAGMRAPGQGGVQQRLAQQDAVCAELEARLRRADVLEADAVPDQLALPLRGDAASVHARRARETASRRTSVVPVSSATRRARLTAATRRGCVTAMPVPSLKRPPCSVARRRAAGARSASKRRAATHAATLVARASSRNCGSCVDLPLPVSPTTMSTRLARVSATSASRHCQMGSALRDGCSSSFRARCCASSGGAPRLRRTLTSPSSPSVIITAPCWSRAQAPPLAGNERRRCRAADTRPALASASAARRPLRAAPAPARVRAQLAMRCLAAWP